MFVCSGRCQVACIRDLPFGRCSCLGVNSCFVFVPNIQVCSFETSCTTTQSSSQHESPMLIVIDGLLFYVLCRTGPCHLFCLFVSSSFFVLFCFFVLFFGDYLVNEKQKHPLPCPGLLQRARAGLPGSVLQSS